MTNDNSDGLFDDAVRSYNAPPVTPREEMWDAIARARTDASVIPISSERPALAARRVPRWAASAAGIAALLMAGIIIGRMSRGPSAPEVAATKAPVKPEGPIIADTVSQERAPAPERVASVPQSQPSVRTLELPLERRSTDTPHSLDVSGDDGAYRLAVIQHLTRTEVLLTSFRAQSSSADAKVDAQFASLSRDLLATTRLLLSRRSDDPTMTRLLQDLELVLMQLSQYAADGRRTDLDAVNQSIEKRNVLPKLRTAIPAGTSLTSGT